MTGLMREGSMRGRLIKDGKGPGALMVGRMDVCDVQTNIPTGHYSCLHNSRHETFHFEKK